MVITDIKIVKEEGQAGIEVVIDDWLRYRTMAPDIENNMPQPAVLYSLVDLLRYKGID